MKVAALYCDYDGTIAPVGVPRAESRVPRGVEVQLRKIAGQVPFCVVTAKDFDFVGARTGFAAGWACVSGLEVRLADGTVSTRRNLRDLRKALELGDSLGRRGVYVEQKRGSRGELLGISFDWTATNRLRNSMSSRIRELSRAGLDVAYDGYSSYADVYAGSPDKGRAVRVLNRLLGVGGATMFIGDSPLDNSAFRVAEISVGVAHGQPMEALKCRFVIGQDRLEGFLRSLADRGMDFAPSMRGVVRKGS